MKDLLDKISSYQIFNYLFPGAVFVALAEWATPYTFIQDDLLIGAFVYYFIGLVVSRVGSLAVEPAIRWSRIVAFADYKDFIKACKNDEKIELLSEVNNTYRTLCSLFLLLLLLKFYGWIAHYWIWLDAIAKPLGLFALLCLFVLSYKKQTEYLVKRVEVAKK